MASHAPIQLYNLNSTPWVRRFLRAYCVESGRSGCPTHKLGYHNALKEHDEIQHSQIKLLEVRDAEDDGWDVKLWPAKCDACAYEFNSNDCKQIFPYRLYAEEGIEGYVTLDEARPGAVLDAFWHQRRGADGKSLQVKMPGGSWFWIDGGTDKEGWMRQGEPPNLTVAPEVTINGQHWIISEGLILPSMGRFK